MKKTLPVLSLLLLSISIKAQFVKGEKFITGSFGGSYAAGKSTPPVGLQASSTTGTFNLNISIAKAYADKKLVTYGFNYSNASSTTDTGNGVTNSKSNSQSAGLSVSNIKVEAISKSFFFTYGLGAGASYNWANDKQINSAGSQTKYEGNGFNVGINTPVSILYRLNKKILLSCGVANIISAGYTNSVSKQYSNNNLQSKNTINNFYAGSELSSFSIGSISWGIWLKI
jgi:hypothetical protein